VARLVDETTALALAARDGDRVALSAFVRGSWGDVTRLVADRTDPAGGAVALGDGVLTEQLLARLDPDRRTAFVLTQLLGFDYAGAAEVCGCPVGTIRSRVARAREQLVAEMQPQLQT
jgi:DNA-directed RNA polymerase specialized sigma24 family protein